jgi:flagellar biosynthesis anti-sigma factor FlgM
MAVEITGLPPVVVQGNGGSTSTQVAHENAGGNKTASPNADVVTLTTQAAHIKALETGRQSVVDGDRIEHLKAAIDAGSYVIDPTRVAEKFIEFEASLSA